MATLDKYVPEIIVEPITELLKEHRVQLFIVNERKTRHGDYRKERDGSHRITVNANLNKYRFTMTLIHEIAHLVAFEKYGRAIKPHGREWKHTFRNLMVPFLRPEVFPQEVLPLLAMHFRNPKASSDRDAALSIALKSYDPGGDKTYIQDLKHGDVFKSKKGHTYQIEEKLRKRFKCTDLVTGRQYLFQPNAEVEFLINGKEIEKKRLSPVTGNNGSSKESTINDTIVSSNTDVIKHGGTYKVEQLKMNTYFKLKNGELFKMQKKLIKNYRCIKVSTSQEYNFNPQYPVIALDDHLASAQKEIDEALWSHDYPLSIEDVNYLIATGLSGYDIKGIKKYIFELKEGDLFKIEDGTRFQKGRKYKDFYECMELKTRHIVKYPSDLRVLYLNKI
jgi:hypothetical protein